MIKSGLLAAVLLLVVFLVSFKMEEPAKEYAKVYRLSNKIRIYFGANNIKEILTKQDELENDMINVLNDLSKEGWRVISVENIPGNLSIHVYLERVKK